MFKSLKEGSISLHALTRGVSWYLPTDALIKWAYNRMQPRDLLIVQLRS